MSKAAFTLFAGLLLSLFFLGPISAQDFQEGTDYKTLSTPVPPLTEDGRVEVVEAFSYHCPHCNSFEPYLQEWASALPDNVELIHLPVIFRPEWEPGARAYYIAESLGVLESTHEDFFAALHDRRESMGSTEDLAAFFAKHGVDREAFEKANGSFEVDTKLRRAQDLAKRFRVMGVPSMYVNGKYEVSGSMAGSLGRMLEIIDYLIAMESEGTTG